jgi:hypothetical protein
MIAKDAIRPVRFGHGIAQVLTRTFALSGDRTLICCSHVASASNRLSFDHTALKRIIAPGRGFQLLPSTKATQPDAEFKADHRA